MCQAVFAGEAHAGVHRRTGQSMIGTKGRRMRTGRMTKALLGATTAAAMVGLAACGGGGGSGNEDDSGTGGRDFQESDFGDAKDPERTGPAPEVEGAQTGGTVTVYFPGDPGPDSLDPAVGWSVTGNSIQQALTNRSLTQFARDPESGQMVLVPDLAVDLGQPNEDYTEWTFEIRDDATWETGDPVTAEEVAFGITRTLDAATLPGPGTAYSTPYFLGGDEYGGPYTDKGKAYDGVTFDDEASTVTIKMSRPFPDMDYWGSFMAMGPAPLGDQADPPDYGLRPLSTGPYKIESFQPNEELILVKNDQWDPNSDPARHQYVDRWELLYNQDQAQVDEIMLSGNSKSQTAISDSLGSNNYARANEELGDRLYQQSTQCITALAPDYEQITDINVRKAIAYAYPYEDNWLAIGEVPGVTRVPANSIMPPGMAGRPGDDYFADGQQFTFNPERSKELLKEAGYEPGEYELTVSYYEPDDLAIAGFNQVKKGYEEGGFKVRGIPIQDSPFDLYADPDNKVNKELNMRHVNWCSDWPSGLTMFLPIFATGAEYNFARFSEPSVDEEIDRIQTLPLEEQPGAWGALDEKIGTDFLPVIPTAFLNDLYVFGESIGNPTGDGAMGAPNFKDLYVTE
ncbi:ABC transporter substrate-binding protein [Nocardioides bigeumensis]|uniref:ABC transporter substrate-binding protein n=2 Tax=Nocardioides bigeumensis TaxID=433657 RepID=A0ABP5KFL8_9ACTN